jgi:hypothetical protein
MQEVINICEKKTDRHNRRNKVYVEQELLTLPEQTSLPPVLRGVGVALQLYVLCLVDYC